MKKSTMIEKYQRRNDKLFHLFDRLTLKGAKLVIIIFLLLQGVMMAAFAFIPTTYLSIAGGVLSLLLTLFYYFNVNESNRRSAIYKLFAWILILPSLFDLGGNFTASPWVWNDIALNTLFVLSGVTMYREFLKMREPGEPLLLL